MGKSISQKQELFTEYPSLSRGCLNLFELLKRKKGRKDGI